MAIEDDEERKEGRTDRRKRVWGEGNKETWKDKSRERENVEKREQKNKMDARNDGRKQGQCEKGRREEGRK